MPSSDLVLNVRQIAGYPATGTAIATDSLLLQRGLGGAYLSISPASLVATALSNGGDMAIGGQLLAASLQSSKGQFSTLATGLFAAQKASIVELCASYGSVGGDPIATVNYVDGLVANGTVHSVNGRRGDIVLSVWDVPGAAPIFAPRFQGSPRALTPPPNSCSDRLATTAFVQRNVINGIDYLLADHPFVFSFNGRTGAVVLTQQDVINAGGDVFDSPSLTGTPTAPTAPVGTQTDQIATTAFVQAAMAGGPFAPIDSPTFSGYVSAPTADPGTANAQVATTAFVMAAVTASTTGVVSFNTRTGAVTLESADISAADGALLASPIFSGQPTAPTPAPGNASQQLATTAFVMAAITAAGGVTSFNGRNGAVTLSEADVTAAGGAPISAPAFTGIPTAATASPGTNTTQLATTAFVMNAVNVGSVASFNGRTGAVTLTANDVSAAGALVNPSPALTGSPTAPTASPGANTTQIATTAFVQAAMAAGGGVDSFNGRAGTVTLQGGDITGAGGALLSSPVFTGTPQAPTAAAGTSNNNLATTAFVQAALVAQGGPFLPLAGGTVTGKVGFGVAPPANLATPSYIWSQGNIGIAQTGNLTWNCYFATGGGNVAVNAGYAYNLQTDNAGNFNFQMGSGLTAGQTFNLSTVAQITGAGTFNGTGAAFSATTPQIVMNKGAGGINNIVGQQLGANRWSLQLGGAGAETGGQAGSAFNLFMWNDAASSSLITFTAARAGNQVTFTNPIVNGSDRRLKTDISPIANALDKVQALFGVSFTRIATGKREIGFIAQDVEPIVPEVVEETGITLADAGSRTRDMSLMLGISYAQLTALLVEAVKTLAQRVETLEARQT